MVLCCVFFFFKQKTAYEIYQCDWSSDVCSSDLYLIWVKNLLRGDLGYSFSYRAPVLRVIASRAKNTLILSFSAVIFTWLFVIPLGVLAAMHHNKFIDRTISLFSYVGISTPAFFLAILLLYFAYVTSALPLGGMH